MPLYLLVQFPRGLRVNPWSHIETIAEIRVASFLHSFTEKSNESGASLQDGKDCCTYQYISHYE
jgi:hypothetical protein